MGDRSSISMGGMFLSALVVLAQLGGVPGVRPPGTEARVGAGSPVVSEPVSLPAQAALSGQADSAGVDVGRGVEMVQHNVQDHRSDDPQPPHRGHGS